MAGYREYDGDGSGMPYEMWERTMLNALRGRKGQAFLRRLEAALVAMPEKRLASGELVERHEFGLWPIDGDEVIQITGATCALGAVLVHEAHLSSGLSREYILRCIAHETRDDEYDGLIGTSEFASANLGTTYALAYAIADENDKKPYSESEEERYDRMLAWVREVLSSTGVTV